ncbi:MAG: sulfatase-like hydrolase/transferase [Luteolibacter sp.]
MLSVLRLVAIANAALLLLASAEDVRPNVVVLAGDFGREGQAKVIEPLVRSGTTYPDCFASTEPAKTLAAWLTGCHELRAGVVDTVGGRNFIHPEVPLISDAFKAAGWRTAFFGTWALGDALPFRPEDRGFQEIQVDGDGKPGDRWANSSDRPWMRDLKGWHQHEGDRATVLETEARKWMTERLAAKERFFLVLNLPAGSERAAASVLEELDRSGAAANTLVVAFGTTARTSPGNLDPVTSMTFRWPGHLPAGLMPTSPSAIYDGFPTVAALCGVPLFRDWKGDGIDLASTLKDPKATFPERLFYFHPGGWPADQAADRYKSNDYVIRKGRWRLSGLDLRDTGAVKDQRENVFETQQDTAMEMMTDYGKWWQTVRSALSAPRRIIVGDDRQPVVPITWGDWWPSREVPTASGPSSYRDQVALRGLLGELADSSKAASLPTISGVWKLHANRTGHYKVTVSKVPATAESSEREALGKLHAGMAHARAGKYEVKTPLIEGATSLSLGVDLNEGDADLEVWFEDQGAKDKLLGAFFATIERVGERKMPDPDFKAKTEEKSGSK